MTTSAFGVKDSLAFLRLSSTILGLHSLDDHRIALLREPRLPRQVDVVAALFGLQPDLVNVQVQPS